MDVNRVVVIVLCNCSFIGDQMSRLQVSTRDLRVHLDTCTSSVCAKAGCQSEVDTVFLIV